MRLDLLREGLRGLPETEASSELARQLLDAILEDEPNDAESLERLAEWNEHHESFADAVAICDNIDYLRRFVERHTTRGKE